ncbi:MAG: alpha/beta hydrolase [Parafilimonas sp.]
MLRKKWLRYLLILLILLVIVYLFGPHPATPVYSNTMPVIAAKNIALENYIKTDESKHRLKPNNEARIIWYNDSLKNKTDYSIVYLHGFSASQEEGRPIHTNITKVFGCNLYLSRLAEHGIDTSVDLINFNPEKYWESAKQALAIGKQLGNKVILMATSTGGSLALKLAAEYPSDVYALVLLSPNAAINNDKAWLLNNPWGLQIAKIVNGDNYVTAKDSRPIYKQYWNWHYPLEAAVQLEELLETTMTETTFKKIKQPVLMLYYYKDAVHQDSVVSVAAMLKMFDELGTNRMQKIKQAIPDAGDHVIASYIKSKDLLSVQTAIENFMKRVLKMQKVNA